MKAFQKIDLNADLGEYQDETGRLLEREVLRLVTSCNIACGGHAGDVKSMTETLQTAASEGVVCGAHPSFPDRVGFGRVLMDLPRIILREALKSQLVALKTFAQKVGVPLRHLKPHGALYNQSMVEPVLATLLAESMVYLAEGAVLVGQPGSALAHAAKVHGINFYAEGFVDRRYLPSGQLMPRTELGAVLSAPGACARQAMQLVQGGQVQTLCLHGDSLGAVEIAKAVRRELEREKICLQSCFDREVP